MAGAGTKLPVVQSLCGEIRCNEVSVTFLQIFPLTDFIPAAHGAAIHAFHSRRLVQRNHACVILMQLLQVRLSAYASEYFWLWFVTRG